jgi:hypothetical protein
MRPDGLPFWVSAVEPGNTHDRSADAASASPNSIGAQFEHRYVYG